MGHLLPRDRMKLRRVFLASFMLAASALAFAGMGISPARAEAAIAAPASAAVAPKPDFAKLFDAVVETIERRFVDEALLKRVDWRGRADKARADIVNAATAEDAVRRINDLLGELKTSHTALYTQDDPQYAILLDIVGGGGASADLIAAKYWGVGPWHPGVGLFTRAIDGRHFVDGVMEGSPADKAGVRYGDEIATIDAAAYRPVAAFRDKVGRMATIEIRRERDGPLEKIDVSVIPIRPATAFAAATRASARIIERNGRRIGYIRLWSVNESRSFQAALAEIEPSHAERGQARDGARQRQPLDALIVDLRGRVGGNVGSAGEILDILDRGQKPYWGALNVEGRSERRWGSGGAPRASNHPLMRTQTFRGRSAMLTNEHTRSAGEIVAYGYKRGAFGPVIGTRTAGAVSGGSIFAMPGDLLLYVAVSGLEFDGRSLEGTGVTPDAIVERPLPYAAGADPVLEEALERLSSAPRP